MSEVRLVRGRWIVTGGAGDDAVLDDAAVALRGGRIEALGGWRELHRRYPQAEVIGSDRVAVLPGLIDAHHHSIGVSGLQQGIPDLLLEPWILMHARARPSDAYLNTLLSAARLLRSGVTSVVDLCGGHGTAEAYGAQLRRRLQAYDEAGLRVALAPGLTDQSHIVSGRGEDERFLSRLPEDLRRHEPVPHYFELLEKT